MPPPVEYKESPKPAAPAKDPAAVLKAFMPEKKAAPKPARNLKPEDQVDLEPFLDFLKGDSKPALAALLGNVYRARRDASGFTFFLDRSHANLIPMLKSANNFKQLLDTAERFFQAPTDINFAVGSDPGLVKRKKADDDALSAVQSDPRVQFILEQFKGKILNYEILSDKKERKD